MIYGDEFPLATTKGFNSHGKLCYGIPAINRELLDKTHEIELYLEDETEKAKANDVMENLHLSELGRIFENADKKDILVVLQVAVRRFPSEYATVLLDYILEKELNNDRRV